LDLAAIVVYLLALGGMSQRLVEVWPCGGQPTSERWALADFRDVVYYPFQAVRAGVNPYDAADDGDPTRYMARYPVVNYFPLYSPLILLVFAPFGLLPLQPSMVLFAACNAILFGVLAWITLRVVGCRARVAGIFGLATLLLLSQPGRAAFNSGQISLFLTVVTIGAIHWGDRRRWTSGLLTALACLKPTIGAPVGLLMGARGDRRSGWGGLMASVGLSTLGMLLVFGWCGDLSWKRTETLITGNAVQFARHPDVVPQTNKARIDLPALAYHLAGRSLPPWLELVISGGVLTVAAGVLWRAAPVGDPSAASIASSLIIITMCVCGFHNIYDALLLCVPLVAAVAAVHPSWRRVSRLMRGVIVAGILVPLLNIFWTDGFQAVLQQRLLPEPNGSPWLGRIRSLAVMANGLALIGVWGVLVYELSGQSEPDSFLIRSKEQGT
jgi:hypothetical protein